MTRFRALSALTFMATLLAMAAPSHSQGYGTERRGGGTTQVEVDGVIRGFTEGVQQLCGNIPDPAFRVDCVADYFDWLADRLPQTQEFREAERIIRDAASQLNRVARDNASTTKRPAVFRLGNSSRQTSRAVIPVAPERQARARSAALAIVEEAETRLLRSADRSQRSRVAFANIASVVGDSSAVLLRAS